MIANSLALEGIVSPLALLKNPMILIAIVGFGFVVGMPYLLENSAFPASSTHPIHISALSLCKSINPLPSHPHKRQLLTTILFYQWTPKPEKNSKSIKRIAS